MLEFSAFLLWVVILFGLLVVAVVVIVALSRNPLADAFIDLYNKTHVVQLTFAEPKKQPLTSWELGHFLSAFSSARIVATNTNNHPTDEISATTSHLRNVILSGDRRQPLEYDLCIGSLTIAPHFTHTRHVDRILRIWALITEMSDVLRCHNIRVTLAFSIHAFSMQGIHPLPFASVMMSDRDYVERITKGIRAVQLANGWDILLRILISERVVHVHHGMNQFTEFDIGELLAAGHDVPVPE